MKPSAGVIVTLENGNKIRGATPMSGGSQGAGTININEISPRSPVGGADTEATGMTE